MKTQIQLLTGAVFIFALTGCLGSSFQSQNGTLSSESLGTPAPTPSPMPGNLVFQNVDGNFDKGGPVTVYDRGALNIYNATTGDVMWVLFADPWGVSQGTGGSSMAYDGKGNIVANVQYSGVNDGGVNGYPFIGYGSGQFGGDPLGVQGPIFPQQLSNMSSLVVETSYALDIRTKPGDLDVAFDNWLVPYVGYADGIPGSVEVMVMYYFDFTYGGGCPIVKTFDEPVTLNGVSTTVTFNETVCGTGPGTYVSFTPTVNLLAADIKVEMMDFMNEAALASGVGTGWYMPGIAFGSEWGAGGKFDVDYTFTMHKLVMKQTLQSN